MDSSIYQQYCCGPSDRNLPVNSSNPTVVRFHAPMLGLISQGLKRLDMRLADDPVTSHLDRGSVVSGVERPGPRCPVQCGPTPFRCRLLVTDVKYFADAGEAYDYYLDLGQHHALFPPEWCKGKDGQPVDTAARAHDFYYTTFFKRPLAQLAAQDRLAVRVFVVQPLRDRLANSPAYLPQTASVAPPAPRARRSRLRTPRMACSAMPRGVCARSCDVLPLPRAIPQPAPAQKRSTAPRECDTHGRPKLLSVLHEPYAPLTAHAQTVAAALSTHLDPALLERVTADARRRAKVRGSASVAARDLRDAAAAAAGSLVSPHPTEVEPDNIDEVVDELARLRVAALGLSGGGKTRQVRVLVVGENSGVVARMFRDAGADVATCDLKPTECEDIPHYEGDAAFIQDMGWDLVIAHPPCTYLANSGVVWLYKDPQRWKLLLQNAALFRRMHAVQAPFVAVENSKMHRFGRTLVGDLAPTQYVHPWQHGTGHTKPTALYLRNLPALTPSCVVEGRKHALARLPPALDRAAARSRTYPGIAAAMAIQWMPVLLHYVREQTAAEMAERAPLRRSAAEMVKEAKRVDPTSHVQVAFLRRLGRLEVVACQSSTGAAELPHSDVTVTPAAALLTLVQRTLLLPTTILFHGRPDQNRNQNTHSAERAPKQTTA